MNTIRTRRVGGTGSGHNECRGGPWVHGLLMLAAGAAFGVVLVALASFLHR